MDAGGRKFPTVGGEEKPENALVTLGKTVVKRVTSSRIKHIEDLFLVKREKRQWK